MSVDSFNKMREQRNDAGAAAQAEQVEPVDTPASIVEAFVADVERGTLGNALAEDCVLNYFGRSVKGAVAVLGYIRTNVTDRFRHVDFERAKYCGAADEALIKGRFGRCLGKLRRRLQECKDKELKRPASLHLRAESDDEDRSEECADQLSTPPRATAQDADMLLYIEAGCTLESTHDAHDGIEPGQRRRILLTLGYRCVEPAFQSGRFNEVCLILYKAFRHIYSSKSRVTAPQRLRLGRSALTDDEGEESATPAGQPRSVKRTLFPSSCDEEPGSEPESEQPSQLTARAAPSESTNGTGPTAVACTPRKRHLEDIAPAVSRKRPTGLSGLRI